MLVDCSCEGEIGEHFFGGRYHGWAGLNLFESREFLFCRDILNNALLLMFFVTLVPGITLNSQSKFWNIHMLIPLKARNTNISFIMILIDVNING